MFSGITNLAQNLVSWVTSIGAIQSAIQAVSNAVNSVTAYLSTGNTALGCVALGQSLSAAANAASALDGPGAEQAAQASDGVQAMCSHGAAVEQQGITNEDNAINAMSNGDDPPTTDAVATVFDEATYESDYETLGYSV